jgi:hypothetical protein
MNGEGLEMEPEEEACPVQKNGLQLGKSLASPDPSDWHEARGDICHGAESRIVRPGPFYQELKDK